jgi:L-ribulose-5-phosphate 3-epimerase
MSRIKIGVVLESLNLPLRRALHEAERFGVAGIQLDPAGDLAPGRLTQTGRREFKNLLRAHSLEISALGCPLRRGLDTPEGLEERIDFVRSVMALAFDFGPRIVVIQAGPAPAQDETGPRAELLRESLLALALHGDRTGTTLALETGAESPAALRAFIEGFDTGSLAVNFDPANLLINGHEPIAALRLLGDRGVHAHARDARRGGASRTTQEVPLGHGDIDWLELTDTLRAAEYAGYLAVERESGANRVADVEAGVRFLRRLVG